MNLSLVHIIRGQQAIHDHVSRLLPLQPHVLPQHPLPAKPCLLQHPLRCQILDIRHRLEPIQLQPLRERRRRRHRPERRGGYAAAPVGVREPVPDWGGPEPGVLLLDWTGFDGDRAHGSARRRDADGTVPYKLYETSVIFSELKLLKSNISNIYTW